MSAFITWLSIVLALYGSTQTPAARIPPMLVKAVKPIEPPEAPGAWVLQVLTRGGLDGRGTGDLFINSIGGAGIWGGDAVTIASHGVLVPQLDQSIRGILPAQWTASTPAGICSDCIVTLMHLAVRSMDGSVQTYSVFWDLTSRAQVAPALMRIHDLAVTAVRK